jgi:hypothetical protein
MYPFPSFDPARTNLRQRSYIAPELPDRSRPRTFAAPNPARRRVLRCKDQAGIEQEMWPLLVVYQAIRHVMVAAVETRPAPTPTGTDPDRAGFTTATGILRSRDDTTADLVGHIGAAVLGQRLGAGWLAIAVSAR